jgi:hypothetical protein
LVGCVAVPHVQHQRLKRPRSAGKYPLLHSSDVD